MTLALPTHLVPKIATVPTSTHTCSGSFFHLITSISLHVCMHMCVCVCVFMQHTVCDYSIDTGAEYPGFSGLWSL